MKCSLCDLEGHNKSNRKFHPDINPEKLLEELRKKSVHHDINEAKLEWNILYNKKYENYEGKCLCGTPLKNIYFIKNIKNNNE